jgi:hypothetical protein
MVNQTPSNRPGRSMTSTRHSLYAAFPVRGIPCTRHAQYAACPGNDSYWRVH